MRDSIGSRGMGVKGKGREVKLPFRCLSQSRMRELLFSEYDCWGSP